VNEVSVRMRRTPWKLYCAQAARRYEVRVLVARPTRSSMAVVKGRFANTSLNTDLSPKRT
jgi:hypothetical protein